MKWWSKLHNFGKHHRIIGWLGLKGTLKSNCISPYSAPQHPLWAQKCHGQRKTRLLLWRGTHVPPPSVSGQRWCFISTMHKGFGSAWRQKKGWEPIDLGARPAGIIHCTEERGKAGTGISATSWVGTWSLSNLSHKTPWHKLSGLFTFLSYSLPSFLMPMKAQEPQETALPLL